jgi:hypothetical protein
MASLGGLDRGRRGGSMTQANASLEVGELYPMGIVVRDEAGVAINAVDVTLTITRPDLTVENPQIGNPPGDAGFYGYDYLPPEPGRYTYVWRTVTPTLAVSGSFDVIPPQAAGIVSLARVKRLLKISPDDNKNDDELRGLIRAATFACELERKETIVRRERVITFNARRPRRSLTILHRPIIAVTSVTGIGPNVAGTWPNDLLDVDEHGILRSFGAPFLGLIRAVVQVGYVVIPDHFQEAAEIIVQHLWQTRGGSAERPRAGGQNADQPGTVTYSIPNRAKDLLGRAGPLVG